MAEPHVFRVGEKGLSTVLGTLEAGIMDALWKSGQPLTVQAVCERLGPGHHYKTVMTVMNRLAKKGLLERRLEGRAYVYRPRITQEAFRRAVADNVFQGVLAEFGDVAIAAFVDVVEEVSPEALAQLERLVMSRVAPPSSPAESPREPR